MTESLIRKYYRCINERRLRDAAMLFADDAIVQHAPFGGTDRQGSACAQFAETWLRAFPDAVFTIEHVEQRSEAICEVDLTASGTHTNALELGAFGVFPPSGAVTNVRLRELLEIRDGKIAYSSVSFDMHTLVHQLATIDYAALDAHLRAVEELRDELARSRGDRERQRSLTERLGCELDAARLLVRPWFRR